MFLELNLGGAGRQYGQAARYSAFAGKMPLEHQNGRLGRCRVVHFTTEVADLPPGARTSRPFGRESGIFSKEKEKGASALIWPGRPSFGAMGGSAENSASYALGVAFKAIPSPELLARLEHQDFFWENLLVKAT